MEGIHPVNPPAIEDGDTVLFDEPGRCGGIDSHCHHYRVIKGKFGGLQLLVRHGGGDERIPYISNGKAFTAALETLDSDGRYWVLNAMYHAQSKAKREGVEAEGNRWRNAAAEKRIKTRKIPSQGIVRVWMEAKEGREGR